MIHAALLLAAIAEPSLLVMYIAAQTILHDWNKNTRRYGARERGRRAWGAR